MSIQERRTTAHLELLHAGVERWNEWRSAHPDEQPDLAQADLRGLDLRKYDLRGADLREASIRGCNFDEADLSRADLTGAFVDESRIIIADPAQRFRRDPYTASFRGCQLGSVRCVWANLQYCDFTGARKHIGNFYGGDTQTGKENHYIPKP